MFDFKFRICLVRLGRGFFVNDFFLRIEKQLTHSSINHAQMDSDQKNPLNHMNPGSDI